MKATFAAVWAFAMLPAFSNPEKSAEPIQSPSVSPVGNCHQKALSALALMPAEPEMIESLITTSVSEFPNCSCEIVKSAIEKTQAGPELVSRIVRAAIIAAPEHMRLTSQCAIAVAPDALAEVQGVLAALEGNAGESGASAKSAKSAKSGKEGVPAKGGGAEPPAASPANDILMNPVHLPIGVPGALIPINGTGEIIVKETTPTDPPL